MNRYLPVILLLLFISCDTKEKKTDAVFFSGEIVNPSNEYVVLYKGRTVIDSAKLDGTNRFSFKLGSIENGLYHFNHEPELQYIYLEKGDSLLVRLNTVAFDESMVFSGTNESINNFLLELFLANEEEEQTMYQKYYDLEPEDFKNQIETLKKEKIDILDGLRLDSNLSKGAYGIAEASIDYTYYRYMEIYPFEHRRKSHENTLHNLPKGFYSYRKNVNYNDDHLTYLRPYYDFMKSHFGNISYMTCANKCGIDGKIVSNQLHFNEHKLHVIDSLVLEKELRDNLFRNVAFNYLLKEHDAPKNNEVFIEKFQKVSQNNVHIKEIENLYIGIQNIQPKNKMPDVLVASYDGKKISLIDIGKDKKVVFYFWSGTNKKHYENIFKRIAELKKEKSDTDYIGINIKTKEENWKGIIQNFDLDISTQYRSENFEELTEKLVIYPMNKCIITDNTIIVDAFSNIYNKI